MDGNKVGVFVAILFAAIAFFFASLPALRLLIIAIEAARGISTIPEPAISLVGITVAIVGAFLSFGILPENHSVTQFWVFTVIVQVLYHIFIAVGLTSGPTVFFPDVILSIYVLLIGVAIYLASYILVYREPHSYQQ